MMMRRLIGLAGFLCASAIHAATFTVTNTNSSGAGSLRQAMLDAQYSDDAKIVFELTGDPPFTINVDEPLPVMYRGVWFEGQSQPGYAGTPLIAIVNRTSSATFDLRGNDSAVHCLRFLLTTGDGVVARADHALISANVFDRVGDPSSHEGAAIRLLGTNTFTSGNTLGYGTCVVVDGGSNNWISDSTFDRCYDYSIALRACDHASINSHNEIHGPLVAGNPAITIDVPAFNTYIGESVITHADADIDVRSGGNDIRSNLIHDVAGYAIRVDGAGSNRITRNTIYDTGEAIVTINGANDGVQPPDVEQATVSASGTTVRGKLRANQGGWRSFELFSSDTCDAKTPRLMVGLGNNNGANSFNASIAPVKPGSYITVTAIDAGHNSSGFSNCVQVQGSLSISAPVITSITPSHGLQPQVVIHGANFTENTKAFFGGEPASMDYFRSDELGVTPQTMGSGNVDLLVRNPDGQEAKATYHFDTPCYVYVNRAPRIAIANGNQPATFTVVASSVSAPIAYQWYRGPFLDRTHPIEGATFASYTATPSDGMEYWVYLSNPCGQFNYEPAKFVSVPRRAAPH